MKLRQFPIVCTALSLGWFAAPVAHAQNTGTPLEQCRLNVAVYFEAGSSSLNIAAQETLSYFAKASERCRVGMAVLIGHSDSAEAVSAPTIGQDRANAVARQLRAALEGTPVVTEDAAFTAPARVTGANVSEPLNRRVDVFLR